MMLRDDMGEKTVYAIIAKKPKSFGRWDTYTLVLTDARIIVAQLTADMLKRAVTEANKAGKADGKGFFQRWGDQLKAASHYSQKYLDMEPEKILRENKANFALSNPDISSISFGRKWTSAGPGNMVTGASLTIESKKKMHSFEIDQIPEAAAGEFQKVFGAKVSLG